MYRVTPKRNKWIVQRVSDRKQIGKPFENKTDAKALVLKLIAEAPAKTSGIKVYAAYKSFVNWMDKQSGPDKKLNKKSTDPYAYDFNLRISKYMDDKLLSDFKVKDMETYLERAYDDGVPYKTLKRSVQFFKQFIKRQVTEENNPCLDVLEFKVDQFNYILTKNQDDMFKPEVQLVEDHHLSNKEGKGIFDLYIKEAPTKPDSAATYALFAILSFTGLRIEEVLGLKKSAVDLERKLLHVRGVSNPAEGGFIKKTKNKASMRALEIGQIGKQFFIWYLDYLKLHSRHNDYLFPSPVTKGFARGYQSCRKLMWKAYARVGLAKLEYSDHNTYKVISELKGSPTKTFRHKFCNALVEAMNTQPLLTANYVKQSAGHSQLATTKEIYGNKKVVGNQELRDARAAAKEEALNSSIIPIPKLIARR